MGALAKPGHFWFDPKMRKGTIYHKINCMAFLDVPYDYFLKVRKLGVLLYLPDAFVP